jgi:hypothetical protein
MSELVEPAPDGLGLAHEHGRSFRVTWRGADLFRYVYRPWDPQVEAPRPYLHPVYTLGGRPVSLYRPHDHLWHKGIAWSLSNVEVVGSGTENFWGGRTYLREHGGYTPLPNDGRMVHRDFDALTMDDDGGGAGSAIRVDELLTWITEAGATVIDERRRMTVTALPEASAWRLGFTTAMRNVSGAEIRFGSPTTEGREAAGYSGLFWRGPRSFSGGTVVTPDGSGGDELMGWQGPWMAFVGRHDGEGGASTLLFADRPGNPRYPTRWFVRTDVYAVLCPAPFFSEPYPLAADDTLAFGYDVYVADGALDADGCAKLLAAGGDPDGDPDGGPGGGPGGGP